MTPLDDDFVDFLLEAKRATYAAGAPELAVASRPGSKDLPYRRGPWSYLDGYYGGEAFSGEEAVWHDDGSDARAPVWSMNYYGTLLGPDIDDDFSRCLKAALAAAPRAAPYRGPELFRLGEYTFVCRWAGGLEFFSGEEEIFRGETPVYRLFFHGGKIR